jgi:hypothetical protein
MTAHAAPQQQVLTVTHWTAVATACPHQAPRAHTTAVLRRTWSNSRVAALMCSTMLLPSSHLGRSGSSASPPLARRVWSAHVHRLGGS